MKFIILVMITISCTSLSPSKRYLLSKKAVSNAMKEIEQGNELKAKKELKSATHFTCDYTPCLTYTENSSFYDDIGWKTPHSEYKYGEPETLISYMKALHNCSKESIVDRSELAACLENKLRYRGSNDAPISADEIDKGENKLNYVILDYGNQRGAGNEAIYFLLDATEWSGMKKIKSALNKTRR